MLPPPAHQYRVRAINEEGITLNTIVRTPRRYKPQDLLAACQNTDIELLSGQPPLPVDALVRFLFNEFFVFEHRTGLYNRQKNLWESLSRVTSISVFQRKSGVLKKQALPQFDIHCLDYRERPLIYAHLIGPEWEVTDKNCGKLLNAVVGTAAKLNGLVGVVFCCPAPIPTQLLGRIGRMVGFEDPVGRYESLLPGQQIPLDLLEMTHSSRPDVAFRPAIRLVHPDLSTVRRP